MNKNSSFLSIFAIIISAISLCLHLLPNVFASQFSNVQLPQIITYQGRLTDASGIPINGDIDMQFCLYDQAVDGLSLWCESYLATNSTAVPIEFGVFTVSLGSQVILPDTIFDSSEIYLGISVNGEDELLPRRQLTSVGYAFKAVDADTVDGFHSTDFAMLDHTHDGTIPAGLIGMFDSNCPAGWDRVDSLDGRFLVGGDSFNAVAGGSNTHEHSAGSYTAPNHTHSVPNSGWTMTSDVGDGSRLSGGKGSEAMWMANAPNVSGGSGTLTISGDSGSADSRPEFATVILCQKGS